MRALRASLAYHEQSLTTSTYAWTVDSLGEGGVEGLLEVVVGVRL
ncbi:hypothetical protein HEB94_004859 [Actinopolymorpha pittospori]|uniref:Uncharacterized protein n=1 Tax=Actinopolymorpha pittospori TaxID=648752 RepID=A0A927RK88_9ACTN|nr:hypothetical protein [Actinopolymorpha pittospori]